MIEKDLFIKISAIMKNSLICGEFSAKKMR